VAAVLNRYEKKWVVLGEFTAQNRCFEAGALNKLKFERMQAVVV
jgi:hypothetical protein